MAIATILVISLNLLTFGAEAKSVIGGGRLGEQGVIVNSVEGDGVSAPPNTSALSYLIADFESGEILAAKNPHKKLPPASTLKTLTALTLLPRINMNKSYKASWREIGRAHV